MTNKAFAIIVVAAILICAILGYKHTKELPSTGGKVLLRDELVRMSE